MPPLVTVMLANLENSEYRPI
jgi:hypothetical protein